METAWETAPPSAFASSEEGKFRDYVASSGAATELVKLLVGLLEVEELPTDPTTFLQEQIGSQDLSPLIKGMMVEDVRGVVAENEALRARQTDLASKLAETTTAIAAKEDEAHAPLLDELVSLHADSEVEASLDLDKAYGALSARFPPAEDAPWLAAGAEPPSGFYARATLDTWARRCFAYGSELQASHAGLSLQQLVECARGGELSEPIELELAAGLHAACVALPLVDAELAELEAAAEAEGE